MQSDESYVRDLSMACDYRAEKKVQSQAFLNAENILQLVGKSFCNQKIHKVQTE